MAYLYRHIRLDRNEPFYIGIGTDSEYKRAYSRYHRNNYWNVIILKTQYEVEIILDDLTKEEAIEKEIEFIKLYGRRSLNEGPLCNLTDGGEGALNMPPESQRKINESKYKSILQFDLEGNFIKEWESGVELKKQYTPNQRISIQSCARGITNKCLGYIWIYKKEFTKEILNNKVNPNIGYKISKALKGKKGKKVAQYSKNRGELLNIYNSIFEASKHTLISEGGISQCCNKKYKTSGGYIWKFIK